MYNFIDVNEASEGYVLPSEALKINGAYIEDQISGYRTLSVSGREALSPEVETFSTGIRDGSTLKNKRYPERIITVKYQLIANSNESFRDAYNKLGGILNVTDAELIFNDEQDKFFVGTPCLIDSVPEGRNAVVAEFEILCTDPFKYSVIEYEAEAVLDEDTILIDYNGTYKAYPTLEADFHNETEVGEDGETAGTLTGNGDCGYVAFFTEDEQIVQLGDPEEVDGETAYAKSQTLMNQTFLTETAWGTTAKKLWAVNNGKVLPADVVQSGSVAMAAATYQVPVKSTSAKILDIVSPQTFKIRHSINAKAENRTANSVKVTFVVTSSLERDSSYFGYGIYGWFYVNGAWHREIIKHYGSMWRGSSGHTSSFTFTITGLSNTAAAINGIKFKTERFDAGSPWVGVPETACSSFPIPTYIANEPASHYMTASSYGTGTKYHGPSITRTLSADSSGVLGATDFTLTYKQMMCIGSGSNDINQLGGFHCHLTDNAGTVVAGVRVVKNKQGSRAASLMLFVNNQKVQQVGIDMSYGNKFFGFYDSAVKTSTITKSGNKLLFNIGGYTWTVVDDAITNLSVTKVTFLFEQYGTTKPLTHNGLYWAKFVKNNCNTFKDIPNKFSANDVVIADCKNGEIRLNGVLTPSLGALGNDWEGFCLTPGLNQIGFSYSDWVAEGYEPTIKVRYREVFL